MARDGRTRRVRLGDRVRDSHATLPRPSARRPRLPPRGGFVLVNGFEAWLTMGGREIPLSSSTSIPTSFTPTARSGLRASSPTRAPLGAPLDERDHRRARGVRSHHALWSFLLRVRNTGSRSTRGPSAPFGERPSHLAPRERGVPIRTRTSRSRGAFAFSYDGVPRRDRDGKRELRASSGVVSQLRVRTRRAALKRSSGRAGTRPGLLGTLSPRALSCSYTKLRYTPDDARSSRFRQRSRRHAVVGTKSERSRSARRPRRIGTPRSRGARCEGLSRRSGRTTSPTGSGCCVRASKERPQGMVGNEHSCSTMVRRRDGAPAGPRVGARSSQSAPRRRVNDVGA